MKKIPILLLCSVLAASCATFPKPADDSSTLLIVDREFQGWNNITPFITYFLIFDDGDKTRISVPAGNLITYSDLLKPGRHKLTAVMSHNLTSAASDFYNITGDIVVEMKEGEATVFPYTFFVEIEGTSPVQYWQKWGLKPLTSERLRSVHSQVMEYPEALHWEPYQSGGY